MAVPLSREAIILKTIRVEKMDANNVAPFGMLISSRGMAQSEDDFTWYGEMARMKNRTTQFNLCQMRAHTMMLECMEVHNENREALVSLGDGVVLALAPKGTFDPQKIVALYLPGGEGIVFEKGTYHSTPFPLSGSVKMLIAFQEGTGENDNTPVKLDEPVQLDTRFLQL